MEKSDSQDQDILHRIQDAEQEIDRLFHLAEAEARSLREEARSRSAEMLRAKKQEWEQRRDSLMAQRLEAVRRDAERIVGQARTESARFRERVEARIPDAVERLFKHLLPH